MMWLCARVMKVDDGQNQIVSVGKARHTFHDSKGFP